MATIDYELHKHQKTVASSPARFRVLVAGRRWGKSSLALALAITHCTKHEKSKVWIVSPTYQQGKDVYWRSAEKVPFWMAEFHKVNYPVKKNDSELLLQFPNGSLLQLKGSDREDTLRGSGLDFVVLDEVASMKPNVWTEIIAPSLLDSGGNALFLGTPMGYNHFYELFLKGKRGESSWDSFQYSSYDNPHLDADYIEMAKKDSDEAVFAQEYLAEFRKYSGLIYPEFDTKTHVVAPIELPQHWTFGIGIDRGIANPSAVCFVAIDPEQNVWVFDEIYQTGLTVDKLLEQIKTKQGTRHLAHRYCDPSARDFIDYASQNNFIVNPAVKTGDVRNWVREGISQVKTYLKVQEGTGKPKLFVFSNCTNLINEFQQYRWKPKQNKVDQLAEPDEPDKQYGFDHELDSLRYMLVSYRQPVEPFKFDNSSIKLSDRLVKLDSFRIGK